MLRLLVFAFATLFIFSCSSDNSDSDAINNELINMLSYHSDNGKLNYFELPQSNDYAAIPQDPKNPITESKVELGKLLFHETMISVNANFQETMLTFSCASCHHAQGGFQAGIAQGIGDGGIGFGFNGDGRTVLSNIDLSMVDVQPIRTPSALNVAYQTNMLWNGQFGATGVNTGTSHLWPDSTPIATNHLGFEGVEVQAIAGLEVHRLDIDVENDLIVSNPEYKTLIDQAFGDVPENERYNIQNIGLAIAAYERTLLPTESGFQKWIRGDNNAMTQDQKEGALLFFETGCGSCHTGPALNSMDFHALGMNDLSSSLDAINVSPDNTENLGRGGFTKKASDNFKFKVPQLYNLKDSPFYGHGSSFNSVREIIEYKNRGVKENQNVADSFLDEAFGPKGLSEREIDLVVDFVENALYDPQLNRYVPTTLPSGFCFPNNDAVSQADIGCN